MREKCRARIWAGDRELFPERTSTPCRRVRVLPAEFEFLQPLDVFALVGDDLGLPDETDAQHAHDEHANHKNQIFLRFGRGSLQPGEGGSHGQGVSWYG